MSYQGYAHLIWALQFVSVLVLLYLLTSRGIYRLFTGFYVYICLNATTSIASVILLRFVGFGSDVYKTFYWIATDSAYVLQLVVAWNIYRLVRVGRSSWVWIWMGGTGLLLLWQVSLRPVSNWHFLLIAGILHVQLYLVIAILVQIVRKRDYRIGTNAAGILGFITITVALNYCLFSAEVFQGLNYESMRWWLQPAVLLATVVAIAGSIRPDLPSFPVSPREA